MYQGNVIAILTLEKQGQDLAPLEPTALLTVFSLGSTLTVSETSYGFRRTYFCNETII